jgi:hypothetical protein
MSTITLKNTPSSIARMTKKQLAWSYYSLHLDPDAMTKDEMLAKIDEVNADPVVVEKVKVGGEY